MSDVPLAKTPLMKAKPIAPNPKARTLVRAKAISSDDTILGSFSDTAILGRTSSVHGAIVIHVETAAPAKAAARSWSSSAGFTACLLHLILQELPAWGMSTVVHMVTLVTMALVSVSDPCVYRTHHLLAHPPEEEKLDALNDMRDAEQPTTLDENQVMESLAWDSALDYDRLDSDASDEPEAQPAAIDLTDYGLAYVPRSDLLTVMGALGATGLSGRALEARSRLVTQEGGNEESEKAVNAALRWLTNHQMPDGGWSFDHTKCPTCARQCRSPGKLVKARNGATALALLPFLGRGDTHMEGDHKGVVRRGLRFLVNQMQGESLNEPGADSGRMYSHGLGAIVLCEIYGMTHDEEFKGPAQAALKFIESAQDPEGGGWRYIPRQPGDTSMVGWQLMALKSGHMSELTVSPLTVHRASLYLDSVQCEDGAAYGYTKPENGEATTAIGLLCRMYLGWKKDNPALQRGVKALCSRGPSGANLYYNYYATQVMRHWQGEEWNNWNRQMRDQLVHAQAKLGHEDGSWFTSNGDQGGAAGGRLYCTAMATMILEVYYRHMPLYREQSVDQEFPD